MTVKIEQIQIEQLPALLALSRQTFIETYAAHNTADNMKKYIENSLTEKKLLEEFANPQSEFYFLVAENEEEPVCYLKINVGRAQQENVGEHALEIERIYVLELEKGKGYGRMLIQKAEAIALAKGKNQVWLGVWDGNFDAIKFYEKMGFTIFGEHSYYLGDDKQTSKLMAKDLG